MFDGDMPRAWVNSGGYWGMILPMEEPRAGQDTQIFVFQSGHGQVLSGAFNSQPEDSSELREILTKNWLPGDVILLVEEQTLNRIRPTLQECGCAFKEHQSGKDLATS